jgi:GH35 family endo-1,4-beta-xylanase/peptidoglycan/xylan/chitin deacetylase (PgdA/CDA1 family)
MKKYICKLLLKYNNSVRLIIGCATAMTLFFGIEPSAAQGEKAPIVILKMDDLTQRGAGKGQGVSRNFMDFIDVLRKHEIKASLGIIGNSLENSTPEFYEWIREINEEGIVEFWNHGHTHAEYPRKEGRRHTEFARSSLEEQIATLRKTQELAREKLGFDLKAFGSPFNQVDGNTSKALDSFPEITSWFFGPPDSGAVHRRSLERRMDLETPVLKPNSARLIEDFNRFGKDLQYIVLQGHPNSWGGKERAEFIASVNFLKEQGCVFMTPSEFLKVELDAPTLPPAPGRPAPSPKPATPVKVLPEPVEMVQLLNNPTLVDEDGDGLPEGWYRSTGSQGDVIKSEDGKERFLRINVSTAGESVILQQFCSLPGDGKPITVAAKVRWKDIQRGEKGYMSGCVQMMFADDKDKKVGDFLPVETFLGTSSDWKIVGGTFTPPEGAGKFRVQLALYSVKKGALDIAWATAAAGEKPALPLAEEFARKNAETTKPHQTLLKPGSSLIGTGPEYGGIKGVSLLGDDPFSFIKPFRNTDKFTVTRFNVEGEPFTDAIRIAVHGDVPAVWDIQLREKCTVPLSKGDVLLLTYWMRGIKTDAEYAETSLLNAMQLDRTPWTKIFEFRPNAMVGDGWVKYQKVIVSPESMNPSEYAFNFQFGLGSQIFEIGGLSLYNYGSEIDPSLLPREEAKLYAGHEADAPWRQEALERIEKIRKADIDIQVVDASGKPVVDVDVSVDMTRHSFGWGTALYAWIFAGNNENSRIYREKFLELFNLMVPENGLKWPLWEQPAFREKTIEMIDWARENGCEVRGHTLVWPSFRRAPQRIASLRSDPEALRKEIENHMEDILSFTKGKIKAWDVMNEPTTNNEFMQILGEGEPANWFKLAHKLEPDSQLFLNENQILAGTKLRSLELYLDKVLSGGGPLGGIGIQGHVGVGTAAPEKILGTFDRLARYNVPLSITELDINTHNEEHQAMYLRDVLTAAFSHPSVDSVTFWGFWDGRHWMNNTPLFRKDWTEKPGMEVYRKLVLNDWWTREKQKTDSEGRIKTCGFLGKYTITVYGPDGKKQSFDAELAKEGMSRKIIYR